MIDAYRADEGLGDLQAEADAPLTVEPGAVLELEDCVIDDRRPPTGSATISVHSGGTLELRGCQVRSTNPPIGATEAAKVVLRESELLSPTTTLLTAGSESTVRAVDSELGRFAVGATREAGTARSVHALGCTSGDLTLTGSRVCIRDHRGGRIRTSGSMSVGRARLHDTTTPVARDNLSMEGPALVTDCTFSSDRSGSSALVTTRPGDDSPARDTEVHVYASEVRSPVSRAFTALHHGRFNSRLCRLSNRLSTQLGPNVELWETSPHPLYGRQNDLARIPLTVWLKFLPGDGSRTVSVAGVWLPIRRALIEDLIPGVVGGRQLVFVDTPEEAPSTGLLGDAIWTVEPTSPETQWLCVRASDRSPPPAQWRARTCIQ